MKMGPICLLLGRGAESLRAGRAAAAAMGHPPSTLRDGVREGLRALVAVAATSHQERASRWVAMMRARGDARCPSSGLRRVRGEGTKGAKTDAWGRGGEERSAKRQGSLLALITTDLPIRVQLQYRHSLGGGCDSRSRWKRSVWAFLLSL